MTTIAENIRKIRQALPEGVKLLAAVKSRTPAEIKEAVTAGVNIIGENYVQEALAHKRESQQNVAWHCIGHVQKNKVNKAAETFDMIQTIDSEAIVSALDRACARLGKVMPVLIEVNSAREAQKHGVYPENVVPFIEMVSGLSHIRVEGLMTMGPVTAMPEDIRTYFQLTKGLFDEIARKGIPHVVMKELSMGMSDSFMAAVEEGATMVRIGTKIFGQRI